MATEFTFPLYIHTRMRSHSRTVHTDREIISTMLHCLFFCLCKNLRMFFNRSLSGACILNETQNVWGVQWQELLLFVAKSFFVCNISLNLEVGVGMNGAKIQAWMDTVQPDIFYTSFFCVKVHKITNINNNNKDRKLVVHYFINNVYFL